MTKMQVRAEDVRPDRQNAASGASTGTRKKSRRKKHAKNK